MCEHYRGINLFGKNHSLKRSFHVICSKSEHGGCLQGLFFPFIQRKSTCSKSTKEILRTYFTTFSSVSIADFEQVNVRIFTCKLFYIALYRYSNKFKTGKSFQNSKWRIKVELFSTPHDTSSLSNSNTLISLSKSM